MPVEPSSEALNTWSGAKDSELNSGARSLRSRSRFDAVFALETSFDAICSAAAGGSDEGGTEAAEGAAAGPAAGEVDPDADADTGLEECGLALLECSGDLVGDCNGRIMPAELPPTAIGAVP